MKNVLDLLARLGETISRSAQKVGFVFKSAWQAVRAVIFKKQVEEENKAKLQNNLLLGAAVVVVIIIITLIVWWLTGFAGNKEKAITNNVANPIADVKVYVVTADQCGDKCWNTGLFTDALTQKGIKISEAEKLSVGFWPFGKGWNFVKKYKITKLPTVVVEFKGGKTSTTDSFFNPALGTTVDGKFVLTQILAPYYDLTAKKLKGLVKVVYLTDKSCTTCYDVKNHETALKNLGVDTRNSKTVDIGSAEGKALIAKYKITKVPTMVITGEVSEYKILGQAWTEVGTIASDGAYIFTNVDLMGDSYKDLTTGQVVKANPAAAVPAASGPSN